MLPVMIYEPNLSSRAKLLDMLESASCSSMLKIIASTGSPEDLNRYIQNERGIMLVILGLSRPPQDNCAHCINLGQQVMQQNRDSYTMFCVYQLEDLASLIPNCMRPAGILLPPFDSGNLENCVKRIVDDYAALTGENTEEGYLMLETGSTTYRIAHSQILYLEALDKKINICTNRQVITVRKSLGSIEDTLPEHFLRCHRSYIVNMDFIARADFAEMSLTLKNGDFLPIARSSKNTLKQQLDALKGSSS